MEEKQFVNNLLEMSKKYDLDKYRKINLKDTHVTFEGTPKKHPYDENILILLLNPFDEDKKFYEFYIDSISSIEELGAITSEDGESAYKIRIWVKKGVLAMKSESFVVS